MAAIDSRVRKTHEALRDALFELMSERGYERLTIQNLLDRAVVGRATFYSHYEGKDVLLATSIDGLRRFLLQSAKASADPQLAFTRVLFEHVFAAQRIFQMTIVPDSEVTVERLIRAMLRDLVRDDLARLRPRIAKASLELGTQFVVGALWSVMVWWLNNPIPLPPAEVNDLFQRLTFPGLAVTLDG